LDVEVQGVVFGIGQLIGRHVVGREIFRGFCIRIFDRFQNVGGIRFDRRRAAFDHTFAAEQACERWAVANRAVDGVTSGTTEIFKKDLTVGDGGGLDFQVAGKALVNFDIFSRKCMLKHVSVGIGSALSEGNAFCIHGRDSEII